MFNTTAYISGAGTTHAIPSGPSVVHTVLIPVLTTNTITFRSVASPAVTYFVFPAATVAGNYELDAMCGNGLDIVAAGSDVAMVTLAI